MINRQIVLDYPWQGLAKGKRAFLKPRKPISGWSREGDYGYISSLWHHHAIHGGRLSVYREDPGGDSGYMVVKGWDELSQLFEIRFASPTLF